MKYLLNNARIVTGTTQTGSHKGEVYAMFQADLINDDDYFANPSQLPRFYTLNPYVIKMYKPYAVEDTTATPNQHDANAKTFIIDLKKVEEAVTKGELKRDLTHIENVFAFTKGLSRPYGRIDRATNQFVIAANGAVTPITAITVYTNKKKDNETGEWTWVEDLDRLINRIIERGYKPLEDSPLLTPQAQPEAPAAAPSANPMETLSKVSEQLGIPPSQQ